MSIKCEGCYEMKNKIKLIQKNNTQLKPIFKVIEWLIRDVNKEKKLLELIWLFILYEINFMFRLIQWDLALMMLLMSKIVKSWNIKKT